MYNRISFNQCRCSRARCLYYQMGAIISYQTYVQEVPNNLARSIYVEVVVLAQQMQDQKLLRHCDR